MTATRISAVICTLNEEDNIGACIASLTGVDEVVVADDGSTDRTVEIAEQHGAHVFRRHDHSVRAGKQHVAAFKKRFGWAPSFKAGDRIRNGHLEQMEAIGHARYGWLLTPDADERLSWDVEKVRALLPTADQVSCEFVAGHDADGKPLKVTSITKLVRKSKARIDGRTHGAWIRDGLREAMTHDMRIDHWQKPGHTQSYVLPILEYSVIVDDDQRSRFYLGREYLYRQQWQHALTLLHRYLDDATWWQEMCKARIYEATCYWRLNEGDKARKVCAEAVALNPDDTEALWLMSELFYEPWKSKWAAIAERATNKDALW